MVLVGEFSKTQEAIDGLALLYVEKHAHGLKRFLTDQRILSRIHDVQRPRLVLDIAKALNIQSDLTMFSEVFHRTKTTRDTISHATHIDRVDNNNLLMFKGFWTTADSKTSQPLTITRQQISTQIT